ncbi:MAG: proteasome assembly chaperone family protein [Candidatus Micrarchaeota archaeon]|nr:proteasome assembly chaperone family protein [Candidatus Micrarchaeota archaeon]
MNRTIIIEKKGVKINNPILIEGLPGIGLVAKIAVDYLIKKSKAQKIAKIYSPYFPPQVIMTKKGIIKMPAMRIYLLKGKKNDFLILAGDIQPNDINGQYRVNEDIVKYFKKKKGKLIITLGGYGTGNIKNEPVIFGAATSKELVEKYSKLDIKFGQTAGSIVGAAGLLIGIGRLYKIDGICLMAPTQGNYIDPKAAFNLLNKLLQIMELKIDTQELENRVAEGEKFIKKLEEMAEKEFGQLKSSSYKTKDLTYIR